MVAITGDTLNSTPPYNSTPGDNILQRQIVIPGVCFLPCYTVCGIVVHLQVSLSHMEVWRHTEVGYVRNRALEGQR